MPKFAKGDRVEFTVQNELKYGVVSRGGATPKVILDGGEYEYKVPSGLLAHSDHPLSKDSPHLMDAWNLKSYVSVAAMSEESVAFTATITKNGADLLAAKNSGRGGCNVYHPISGGYGSVAALEQEAKRWLMDNGMDEGRCVEAADTWIDWKVNKAPYGITAKNYVSEISGIHAVIGNKTAEVRSYL